MSGKLTLKMCPRCGTMHEVETQELSKPKVPFDSWATCELTGEPILLVMGSRLVEEQWEH